MARPRAPVWETAPTGRQRASAAPAVMNLTVCSGRVDGK